MPKKSDRAKGSGRTRAAQCPCGSGEPYSRCCRRFHLGHEEPPTAEALMRARYSAYAKRLPDYVASTWHPSTRPDAVELDRLQRWTELEILSVSDGGEDDVAGLVEFIARHETGGRRGALHERSRFERRNGTWTYFDGEISP